MEILGYFASALIGFSLGLIGAGGSILTVPVMVYLFKEQPAQAVKSSLFIVGMTSFASILPRFRKGEILIYQGGVFASISLIVVYLTRKLLLPRIPSLLYTHAGFSLSFNSASMICFAALMLIAGRKMILTNKQTCAEPYLPSEGSLTIVAVMTGFLTGLLGAGGGFLIVPALMVFFRIDIKKAIGTSLFIISLNTLTGFLCEIGDASINWFRMLLITSLSILGSYLGHRISKYVDRGMLKNTFGWFIASMAILIIVIQGLQLAK